MFERFTLRNRRIVVLAQEEARMLNHSYVGSEHLLLGILHEGTGIASELLADAKVSLEVVRRHIEDIIGLGTQSPSGHIPFTPRAKMILELSLRETIELKQTQIDVEHTLLGLLREGQHPDSNQGVAVQILKRLNVDPSMLRATLLEKMRPAGDTAPTEQEAAAAQDGGFNQLAQARIYGQVLQRRWAAGAAVIDEQRCSEEKLARIEAILAEAPD